MDREDKQGRHDRNLPIKKTWQLIAAAVGMTMVAVVCILLLQSTLRL